MSRAPVAATLASARRLAVVQQRLLGERPRATSEAILSVVRDLAYVQWDPIRIVAPSHLLSFWARLEGFRPVDLERLLWREKSVFLHWTPIASIVLTEDYPIYAALMRGFPESLSPSWGTQERRARRFLDGHRALRHRLLKELENGPLPISRLRDHRRARHDEGEWEPASDAALMLYYLTMQGKVMVVGHEGAQNLYGLTEEFLPASVPRAGLSDAEFERVAAQRAIRALGTATPREITYYYPRGRYDHLERTLGELEGESVIHRVEVEGSGPREKRFVHDRDLPLLGAMPTGSAEPRVSLLPPFDTLIGNPERTRRLFGFDYVREQFLPKAKRKYGTYVLPILWGDRLIGRIDPKWDSESGTLTVHSVHAEPGAPRDREVGRSIAREIERLAEFVGARRVSYSSRVPALWRSALR